MRLGLLGVGYVGLVSACLSDFGHDVICIDKQKNKKFARRLCANL